MSNFGKGKRYSWLPESNPSALSGDTNGQQQTLQRSDSGEKTPKTNRSGRKAGRGRGKDSKAGSFEERPEGLGITTKSEDTINQNGSSTSMTQSSSSRNNSTTKRQQRRARKDSVDDLVRSRFMSMNSQSEDSRSDAGRRGEQVPMAAITANVRDALASEQRAARGSHSHTANGEYSSRSNVRLSSLESKYSFPSIAPLSQRNVTSSMRRGDHGVASHSQPPFEAAQGENVIVIHPGSRWLRIGRASQAVPREIPHVAARRLKVPVSANNDNVVPQHEAAANEAKAQHSSAVEAMDVDRTGAGSASDHSNSEDGDSDSESEEFANAGDSSVDETLSMLRTALKQHQRHSKRKVPSNAYSQVISYNRQSQPETIQDHNDPYRIEWIMPSDISEDCVTGESALRIADDQKFSIRWPIRNGCFNVETYASIEDVLGDLEAIWLQALENELGIRQRELKDLGVVLVIPDIFNRLEVAAMGSMLLQRMGFGHLLVQQSSTLVTFGAGFSSACVVDVGAQKTSISCVEDGHCAPESRVLTMYGGDDITRFLYHLFVRSHFPYAEAQLNRAHDWMMLTDLRERFCTVNLSDVNIRLHSFFVRKPNAHTLKYSFKTYDEPYQAPLCLFYPSILDAYYELPNYQESFVNASYPRVHGESKLIELTATRFGILPYKAKVSAETSEAATAPATVPETETGTPDVRAQSVHPTESLPSLSSVKDKLDEPPTAFVSDSEAQYSRIPLDVAITHSIAHSGSIDRARKLYTSIVIVGGGVSFIPGFDDLLASRLMLLRPEFLRSSVERVDIVAPPRDLDPRVLAWKGGAVLGRLECAREMWVSSTDWSDFGPRMLRDRVLFQW
ncbi:actin-like protein arp8 [Coemansia sp. RSA 990]|nr:actin-like protein arp8 [Coemansia sp. RSA 1821]KAJ1869638.1 actin-like protein arp8 [Coemansia sp. RSA 990]